MEAYFQNMVEELRQMRRDLHKIPELGLKNLRASVSQSWKHGWKQASWQ